MHSLHETYPALENQPESLCRPAKAGHPLGDERNPRSCVSTIARLRTAQAGCPWDQEQTHQTLARCLIDECSELLDTIDRLDMPHMREELGDVLIQVVFHAQLAQEAGLFDLEAVAREVNEKLVRRHPHVFGDGRLETSEQVLTQWEQIKAGEKKARGSAPAPLFKEMPPRLPALMYAEAAWKQVRKKDLVAESGADSAAVSRMAEGLTPEVLGRALFEIVAAAAQAQGTSIPRRPLETIPTPSSDMSSDASTAPRPTPESVIRSWWTPFGEHLGLERRCSRYTVRNYRAAFEDFYRWLVASNLWEAGIGALGSREIRDFVDRGPAPLRAAHAPQPRLRAEGALPLLDGARPPRAQPVRGRPATQA